jgi:hypothetical protein
MQTHHSHHSQPLLPFYFFIYFSFIIFFTLIAPLTHCYTSVTLSQIFNVVHYPFFPNWKVTLVPSRLSSTDPLRISLTFSPIFTATSSLASRAATVYLTPALVLVSDQWLISQWRRITLSLNNGTRLYTNSICCNAASRTQH